MKMRACVVTLAIGDKYLNQYNKLFRPSNEFYAAKHGYDFKVITQYLDPNLADLNSVTIHKYLLCSQEWSSQYDYLIVIDADILINKNSPPVPFELLGDKVGMVDEACQPSLEKRVAIQRAHGWELYPTDYMALCGYALDTPHIYNSGFMVLQPSKHRTFLENMYATYGKGSLGHPRKTHYEQTTTNYCFQTANMVYPLPHVFNTPWFLYKADDPTLVIDKFFESNCFVHFVASVDYQHVQRLWNNNV